MTEQDPGKVTVLIQATRGGDETAKDQLFTLVYDELRRIAARRPGVGKAGQTMQATALVHEAYIFFERRFPQAPAEERENREVFFRTVALAMRAILKDYWRKKKARKRGGDQQITPMGEMEIVQTPDEELSRVDFLALDQTIDRLEERNARWFGVVLHRYFAGRSIEETAELMGIATATVKSDWKLARAWLLRELEGGDPKDQHA